MWTEKYFLNKIMELMELMEGASRSTACHLKLTTSQNDRIGPIGLFGSKLRNAAAVLVQSNHNTAKNHDGGRHHSTGA